MKYCKEHGTWYYEEHMCKVCWEDRAENIENAATELLEAVLLRVTPDPSIEIDLHTQITKMEEALNG